jgi:molybdopterin molybdotransferase
VALEQAAGRVLAADVVALIPVPHYASSAMDGWAVAGEAPWRILRPDATAGQGRPAGMALRPGEAVPIVTGAVIPPGTHGVLRTEHGAISADGLLTPNARARPGEPRRGQHIRLQATEAAGGETVISAATVLSPAHVAAAAGCGHDDVEVVRRARVALVLTGAEVVERGIPAPGTVRDSFGPVLPALLAGLGAEVVSHRRIGDDFEATLAQFGSESEHGSDTAGHATDLIVTTGGTGASPADHVRPALRAAGAEVLVDGIAVRPGSPALLARLPDGRFVIGLPGNPLAALLALLTLAHPLVSAMQGRGMPPLGTVRIAVDLPAPTTGAPTLNAPTTSAPTTSLRPYRLVSGAAQPTAWHGAGMLRGLAEADGVLVVPAAGAAAGDQLEVLTLPW